MWEAELEQLPKHRGIHISIMQDSRPATVSEGLHAWQNDAGFRSEFSKLLAELPYTAFRWELPPITEAELTRPLEFVVLDAPELVKKPNPSAFTELFRDARDDVATFPNLGGDAILIVPCPAADMGAYGHLGAFVRLGPPHQQQALWKSVGTALARRSGTKPVWLSTAGAGVSWLHVRLDDKPKYYGYDPYRMGRV
jgi:hypothetical protein